MSLPLDLDSLSLEELQKRKKELEENGGGEPLSPTDAGRLDVPNTTGRDVTAAIGSAGGAAVGISTGLLNDWRFGGKYNDAVGASDAAAQTAQTAEEAAAKSRSALPPQPGRPNVTVTGVPPDYKLPTTPIPQHPGFADRRDIAPPNPRKIPQAPGATNVGGIQPFVSAPVAQPPNLQPEAPIRIPGQEVPPASSFNERGTSGDRWTRKVVGSLGPGAASSTEAARNSNIERSLTPNERAQFAVNREGIIIPNTTEDTMARIRQNELEAQIAGNREANTNAQRDYANKRSFTQDMQQRRQAQLTNDLRLGQAQNAEGKQGFQDTLKREDQVLKQKFSIYNALRDEAAAAEKRINDLYNAQIKAAGLDTNRSSQEYKALEAKWRNELLAAKQTFDQKIKLFGLDETRYKDQLKYTQGLEDEASKARSAATEAAGKASGLKKSFMPLTAAYEGSKAQKYVNQLGSGLDTLATGATKVLDSTPGRIVGGGLAGLGIGKNVHGAFKESSKGNYGRASLHGLGALGEGLTLARHPYAFIPGIGLSLASEAALWGLDKFAPQTQPTQ